MLALWCLSPAHAAEVVFLLATPVQVQVDGLHIETITSSNAEVKNLEAGAHTVRILDMLSKPVLTQGIVLAADDQVVMRYKSKALIEQSRGKLNPVTTPAPTGGGGTPMSSSDFSFLLGTMEKSENDKGRLDLVTFAVLQNRFSVDQTVTLMSKFQADAQKIEVVKVVRPRLTDPERSFVLITQVSEASKPQLEALFKSP